ncbi:hypothetical protein [Cupriavidus sp. SZY C1]|uniref:hypothetical protein n=1 Tax=Cupriavidus sp. SZY C1 TaxID=3055037 RepID=UPI003918E7C2
MSTITLRGDAVALAEATALVDLTAFWVFFADVFAAVDFVAAYVAGAAIMATDTSAAAAKAVSRGRPKRREIMDSVRNMSVQRGNGMALV